MNKLLTSGHRICTGYCPKCEAAIIIVNNFGIWPLAECSRCDWKGGTPELKSERYLEVGERPEVYA